LLVKSLRNAQVNGLGVRERLKREKKYFLFCFVLYKTRMFDKGVEISNLRKHYDENEIANIYCFLYGLGRVFVINNGFLFS
jgi:hypothetical protein